MDVPDAFCWTKFGTEAGEAASSIRDRKEDERQRNGGVFLWGIGNSIGPSLRTLLAVCEEPAVLFSPMLVPPKPVDVTPEKVVRWRSATGLDGSPYEIPDNSLVTSRLPEGRKSLRHYALVCKHDSSIFDEREDTWLDIAMLRNLRTGSVVGSSQVTSIVRYLVGRQPTPKYRVAFRATLVYPYLVSLHFPECITSKVDQAAPEPCRWPNGVQGQFNLALPGAVTSRSEVRATQGGAQRMGRSVLVREPSYDSPHGN